MASIDSSLTRIESEDFKTYLNGLNLNFNIVEINVVKLRYTTAEPYFSFVFARKTRDGGDQGARLFSVDESSGRFPGQLLIGDYLLTSDYLLTNNITLSDLGNLSRDIDSIYSNLNAYYGRNKYDNDAIMSINEKLNITLNELIEIKMQKTELIEYYNNLELNFIIKNIFVINIDKFNSIPYLIYDIYNKDDDIHLFQVREDGFGDYFKLIVDVGEITIIDVDRLKSDIIKIYNKENKNLLNFDFVDKDFYFQSKESVRDKIMSEIEKVVLKKSTPRSPIEPTTILPVENPDEPTTILQVENPDQPTTIVPVENPDQPTTIGTPLNTNIESSDKSLNTTSDMKKFNGESCLSALQVFWISFGAFALIGLIAAIILFSLKRKSFSK